MAITALNCSDELFRTFESWGYQMARTTMSKRMLTTSMPKHKITEKKVRWGFLFNTKYSAFSKFMSYILSHLAKWNSLSLLHWLFIKFTFILFIVKVSFAKIHFTWMQYAKLCQFTSQTFWGSAWMSCHPLQVIILHTILTISKIKFYYFVT